MYLRQYRNYINRGLWALLVCFLAVRGLVPAGFMPSALSDGGGPYQLCHGDTRAALLLNSLQASPVHEGHHNGHHGNHHPAPETGHDHDPATAKHFADSTCAFAAAAAGTVGGDAADLSTLSAHASYAIITRQHLHCQPAYFTPPGRAPPAIS